MSNNRLSKTKISSSRKKDVHSLLRELEKNPSHEIITALHQIIVDYTVDPSGDVDSTSLFRISIFREERIPSDFRKEFEVLRETANYARSIDCEKFLQDLKRTSKEIKKDKNLVKILKYLSSEGPKEVKHFKEKLGIMSGFERTVEKGIDKELMLINNKDEDFVKFISITHKGRRVLRYISQME